MNQIYIIFIVVCKPKVSLLTSSTGGINFVDSQVSAYTRQYSVDANGSVKVEQAFWMAPEVISASCLRSLEKGELPPVPDTLSRDARDFYSALS
ncbi:hypothetical protein MTR_0099s0080 [Medicago truncatula]|uniref:Uncharacterized protein n=1 Tax=Medicago truncatula TaxID=3880 RepID=A0A072THP9_MEDTR|nr:hypothetical protein MTR_0099s0080 [Medicago truncatula]